LTEYKNLFSSSLLLLFDFPARAPGTRQHLLTFFLRVPVCKKREQSFLPPFFQL
jgi:hypothetical protein